MVISICRKKELIRKKVDIRTKIQADASMHLLNPAFLVAQTTD